MKKISSYFLLSVFASFFLMPHTTMAQSVWQSHNFNRNETEAVINPAPQNTGGIYLGWCDLGQQIYQSDGLSPDRDCRAGAAIKVPREKFKHYIGGSLIGISAGWDAQEMEGEYEIFARTSLNGKNIASGKGKVVFGWNTIMFDQPIELPDADTLVLGFYAQLKKDICAIPRLFPQNRPMTCYLWQDDSYTPDGKELWYDGSEFLGTLPLLGLVQDDKKQFTDMLEINKISYDRIVFRDSTATCLVNIKNVGSTPINSVTIQSEYEDKVWTQDINFKQALPSSANVKTPLPYRTLGSGLNKFKVIKVNGVENKINQSFDINLLTIPQDVAKQYNACHLIEFFTSENSFYPVTYYEEYMRPYLEAYKDKIAFVCHHTDDQFMIGEEDDAIKLMLDFVNNDSLQVFLPSMGFNRSFQVLNQAHMDPGPLFPVWYPDYGAAVMEQVVKNPTFASVKVESQWTDSDKKLKINVTGDVAEGILPAGEELCLTVYLLEYDVITNSQQFWDEQQSADYNGIYHHPNIIRQNLTTALYGQKLEKTGGQYTQSFEIPVNEYWHAGKLGVVAFLNRGTANGILDRQIINSCEHKIAIPTGIECAPGIEVSEEIPIAIYDITGTEVKDFNQKGIFIVKSVKNGQPVIRKVFIK